MQINFIAKWKSKSDSVREKSGLWVSRILATLTWKRKTWNGIYFLGLGKSRLLRLKVEVDVGGREEVGGLGWRMLVGLGA